MSEKLFCVSCGASISSSDKFCAQCGTELSGSLSENLKQSKPSKKQHVSKSIEVKFSTTTITIIAFVICFIAIVIFETQSSSVTAAKVETASAPQMQATDPNVLQKITELEKVVQGDSKNNDAVLELANSLHDAKFFPRAIDMYKKYLATNPKYNDARVDMAICYYEIGENQKAIDEIKTVLKNDSKHQMALYNLGIIYLSEKNVTEAKKWLRQCIEIDSKSNVGQRAQEILTQH